MQFLEWIIVFLFFKPKQASLPNMKIQALRANAKVTHVCGEVKSQRVWQKPVT